MTRHVFGLCAMTLMLGAAVFPSALTGQIVNGMFNTSLDGWMTAASPPGAGIVAWRSPGVASLEVITSNGFPQGVRLWQDFSAAQASEVVFTMARGGTFDSIAGARIYSPPNASSPIGAISVPHQTPTANLSFVIPSSGSYRLEFYATCMFFAMPPFHNTCLTQTTVDNVAVVMDPGLTQNNPILPQNAVPPGNWTFIDGPSGRWYDPIPSYGYRFSASNGKNFSRVGMPVGLGDRDNIYYVVDSSGARVAVNAGGFYDFPTPIANFAVEGIFPTVEGENPQAFPIFLGFDHPSASFTMTAIDVLSADFDADGQLTCSDVNQLTAAIFWSSNDPKFDLDANGLLNTSDLNLWLRLGGAANLPNGNPYLTGDANLDGVVDGSDFVIWNSNKFTASTAWCSGDFNADGFVDGSDFVIWNSNKFTSSDGSVLVPEPIAVPVYVVAGMLFWMHKRRHRDLRDQS